MISELINLISTIVNYDEATSHIVTKCQSLTFSRMENTDNGKHRECEVTLILIMSSGFVIPWRMIVNNFSLPNTVRVSIINSFGLKSCLRQIFFLGSKTIEFYVIYICINKYQISANLDRLRKGGELYRITVFHASIRGPLT